MDALAITTAFQPTLVPSAIDQNATHCLGSGSEEMSPSIPVLRLTVADNAKICLMNEGGRLKCLARLLVRQSGRGELAKFVINERKQIGSVMRIVEIERRLLTIEPVHRRSSPLALSFRAILHSKRSKHY